MHVTNVQGGVGIVSSMFGIHDGEWGWSVKIESTSNTELIIETTAWS